MTERDVRHAAVERAYRDHADDLYRVAFGILRDADAAVDATHAAFARAFERWAQYDPSRPLLPWLHGIVAHEALDAIRRSRVRRIAVATIAERDIASWGTPGQDLAARVAERAAIDAGLAQLKPAARAALLLRHVYGYDYAEIARLLGTSQGNVGAMLSRSHARLRELLVDADAPADTTAGAAYHRAIRSNEVDR
jgi:RNA polymerase sigma-70 factor (ECF subfamily)